MKHLITLMLFCLPLIAGAQSTPVFGPAANAIGRIEGGIKVGRVLIAPILTPAQTSTLLNNSYSTSPNIISPQGAITVDANGLNWYFNGWNVAASKAYVDNAVSSLAPTSVTGTSTQSGTGAKVVFSIPHGLGVTPTYINAVANTNDAGGIRYITADSVNIYVNYSIAPAAGTNNLIWSWIVRP